MTANQIPDVAEFVALPTKFRTAAVLAEISDERSRQDEKWGEQNHPDGTGPRVAYAGGLEYAADRRERARHKCDYEHHRGTGTWAHILEEEHTEALAEDDPAKLRAELVQVTAVAVAWIEAIDRRERDLAAGDHHA